MQCLIKQFKQKGIRIIIPNMLVTRFTISDVRFIKFLFRELNKYKNCSVLSKKELLVQCKLSITSYNIKQTQCFVTLNFFKSLTLFKSLNLPLGIRFQDIGGSSQLRCCIYWQCYFTQSAFMFSYNFHKLSFP